MTFLPQQNVFLFRRLLLILQQARVFVGTVSIVTATIVIVVITIHIVVKIEIVITIIRIF